MKRTVFIALLAAASFNAAAQSSDAAYPQGGWQNELPAEKPERPYYVYIEVGRVTEPQQEYSGRVGCGYISVIDNKTEKEIYSGLLTYAGKGLKSGVGNGIYYFNVVRDDASKAVIGLRKSRVSDDGIDLDIVSLTGAMANHSFTKETLSLAPVNGSWTPATIGPLTEKELLENLADALKDEDKDRAAHRTRGYGDVRQYINAHKSLNPALPKYARAKGSNAVTLRDEAKIGTPQVGELKAGEALLVVDEYDGWCQLKIGEKKFGWAALASVTLSNSATGTSAAKSASSAASKTSAAASSSAAKASSSFVLGNRKLGPLSLGQTVASLPKSVAGLYDSYKVVKEQKGDMDGTWTETWCNFSKGGKVIFKAFIESNKIQSFSLEEGSSFIKTTEGYYVGSNARELFSKKPMTWENWFVGTAFARSGQFEFHIADEDLNNTDIPTKASDVKPSGKISRIVYYSK